MRRLVKKIRSRKGETLAEILVSVLIVALSALLIASMFTAAGSINAAVKKLDENFYESVTQVESQSGTSTSGTVHFQIEDEAGNEEGDIQVDIYTDESKNFSAYSKADD